jgi:hypothetical protein
MSSGLQRRLRTASALIAVSIVTLVGPPAQARDLDEDGLRDGFETKYRLTGPDVWDSDGDGVIDSAEDGDGDGLSALGEQRFGTSPRERDTDRDGRPDGREDEDRDGRSNALEQDQRPLPIGLRPSLAEAPRDITAHKPRCQTRHGASRLVRCAFGSLESGVTIALVGDSHATMLLPAFVNAARNEGWGLVTLLKGSCVPLRGMLNASQYERDHGRSCRRWRGRALDHLRDEPVDLVASVFSEDYRLVDDVGRTLAGARIQAAWAAGVRDTLASLSPASRVVVFGDVPENDGNPVTCLRRHRRDMAECVAPKLGKRQRGTEDTLRKAAAAGDARFRTLYEEICSYDPCPLVQGDVLIYRDHGHLTTTFAKRLTPSLQAKLRTVLGAR